MSTVTDEADEETREARALFARQLAALGAGDLDALMDNYAEDAVLVRADRTARGREEVRALMAAYLGSKPEMTAPPEVTVTADVVLYRARMRLGGAEMATVGTFVLRDGLIWRQTMGVVPLQG